jgi:hypothetical protein
MGTNLERPSATLPADDTYTISVVTDGEGLSPAVKTQQRGRHVVNGVFFFDAVGVGTGEMREHWRDLEMD